MPAPKDRRSSQRVPQAYVPKADSSYVARRIARHLTDLERTNYTEPTTGPAGLPIDTGANEEASRLAEEIESGSAGRAAKGASGSGGRKKQSHNVRSLLLYRKSTAQLIEESNLAEATAAAAAVEGADLTTTSKTGTTAANYLTAKAGPSKYPPRELCSVCGAVSAYRCIRCGMMTCSLACRETHDDTRCERR